MGRFILKHITHLKPQKRLQSKVAKASPKKGDTEKKKLTKSMEVKEKVMTTDEKVAMANSVLNGDANVKKLKKDKGLIERTESSKTILTEDNKELLID